MARPEARAGQVPETQLRSFTLFIHHMNSEVPTAVFELSSDLASARRLAERALAESPNRLLVEVREDDRLAFSLDRNGVRWMNSAERASG